MFSTNRSPAIENGGQNGMHRGQRAPNNYLNQIYYILTMTWSLH
jgi:hypothetical protein